MLDGIFFHLCGTFYMLGGRNSVQAGDSQERVGSPVYRVNVTSVCLHRD